MTKVRSALVAVLVYAGAGLAVAADPAALPTFFPTKAPVFADGPGGLVRMPLPAAVRAEIRPDLSDVRILDPQGREVPYLVDVPGDATMPTLHSVGATVIEAFREERRRDDAPPLRRETFVLETPEKFDASGTWLLVIGSAPRDFVRRVDVSQQAPANAEGQPASENVSLVEGRSIFRLAGGSRVRTSLELPGLQPGRLAVTLEGEDDAYLSPTFHFEQRSQGTAPARIDVALAERTRRHEPGRTILVLGRPAGIVPERIRILTATATFARSVVVKDVLPTGRTVVVGESTIRRRDYLDPEPALGIPVRPAEGEQLEIAIEDQDSPPLESVIAMAEVREVALVFSLAAAEGPAAILYFGGDRVRAPRYDIAKLFALLDKPPGTAHLGEIEANSAFEDRPLLGFAMRPGASLDPSVFAWRRSVTIPASRTGLARVRLQVADLAAARPDLADLRVVDSEGRQWPYLLERDAVLATVPLETTRVERGDRETRFTLSPGDHPLRLAGIELDVDAGFVDRPFTLVARDEAGKERTLAGGRLQRAAGVRDALSVSFADTRVTGLTLVVRNGDEAELAVSAVRAICPLSELYVAAPPGSYGLLAGDPEADAPQYEIAGLRSTVLALPAVDVTTDAGAANPEFSRSAATARHLAGGRVLPRIAVWIVLIAAVVVLTLLTLRLVRREGAK